MSTTPSNDPTPPTLGWQVGDAREIVHTFSAADVEAFARLTGDRNPLHVDAAAAARSAAGGPVVHGMLAAAFVSTLIGMELPGPGALWQSFSVNWRKMIRTGDTLRLRARVTAIHGALRLLELDVTGQHVLTGDTYLDGTARVIATMTTTTTTEQALTGRRVLITGASGVLGGSIARSLAGAGAIPVLTGRDASRLEAIGQAVGAASGDTVACDLEDPGQVASTIGRIRDAGGVFGIVHAAAAPLDDLAADDPANADALRRHWSVGVAALQQLAAGLLGGDHGPGILVAVLTEAILNAPPVKRSAYVAAKMGAWSLIRSFAAELGPKGVRCNAVSPGLMETPYTRDVSVSARLVEAANTPLRRLCTPEDVADAVLFLASPHSKFVNGANLPVTGGLSMP